MQYRAIGGSGSTEPARRKPIGSVPKLDRPVSLEEMAVAIAAGATRHIANDQSRYQRCPAYLLPDNLAQTHQANRISEQELSDQNPGSINLATSSEMP
jgi:hypothetical protein